MALFVFIETGQTFSFVILSVRRGDADVAVRSAGGARAAAARRYGAGALGCRQQLRNGAQLGRSDGRRPQRHPRDVRPLSAHHARRPAARPGRIPHLQAQECHDGRPLHPAALPHRQS